MLIISAIQMTKTLFFLNWEISKWFEFRPDSVRNNQTV